MATTVPGLLIASVGATPVLSGWLRALGRVRL